MPRRDPKLRNRVRTGRLVVREDQDRTFSVVDTEGRPIWSGLPNRAAAEEARRQAAQPKGT